jgi:hypothetical protein
MTFRRPPSEGGLRKVVFFERQDVNAFIHLKALEGDDLFSD